MSAPLASPGTATLPRPHLLARIVGDEARPATLVVAPAGFGKSTLLAQAAGLGRIVRLRAHEGAALHWLDPPEREDAVVPATELPAVFERLEPPSALALDDAHLLDEACHAVLAELFAKATPQRRVVIASRRRLPLELTGSPSADPALEVGPRELRFRFWEVAELFRSCYLDPLPPEVAAGLARRPAGGIERRKKKVKKKKKGIGSGGGRVSG
jgi:ATP/maltotriose-dependent transcriptional regulator MalT